MGEAIVKMCLSDVSWNALILHIRNKLPHNGFQTYLVISDTYFWYGQLYFICLAEIISPRSWPIRALEFLNVYLLGYQNKGFNLSHCFSVSLSPCLSGSLALCYSLFSPWQLLTLNLFSLCEKSLFDRKKTRWLCQFEPSLGISKDDRVKRFLGMLRHRLLASFIYASQLLCLVLDFSR